MAEPGKFPRQGQAKVTFHLTFDRQEDGCYLEPKATGVAQRVAQELLEMHLTNRL